MDTAPMPLDELAAAHDGLDNFRIARPSEVLSILRQLADANTLLNFNGSDGTVYSTHLLSIDPAQGTIGFSAESENSQVQSLVEAEDAIVVAYVDKIKLQFDATDLLLVRGARTGALTCAIPQEIFRFQRREGYRVRPLMRGTPVARLRHPMMPDMSLALRVLDVSIGGCALFLPDDVPPIKPGVVLNGVQIELNVDTHITTALRLQHVTSLNPESQGVRLGCEMVNPSSDTLRNLQRYIDQTQKRQRLFPT